MVPKPFFRYFYLSCSDFADKRKGAKYSPYIIAEMSANHNGNIDNAFKIIEMASDSGADAVKLQTYRYQRRLHGKQNYLQSALTIKS